MPRSTATPLRLSHRKARPAWAGFGSVAATTTLEMPAPTMAHVQGGVRPLVEHGSSVTKRVTPLVGLPLRLASEMASTSAWGKPARRCQPRPMIFSPLASTAPTSGLGDVSPLPRLAKRNASLIRCPSFGSGGFLGVSVMSDHLPLLLSLWLVGSPYFLIGLPAAFHPLKPGARSTRYLKPIPLIFLQARALRTPPAQ